MTPARIPLLELSPLIEVKIEKRLNRFVVSVTKGMGRYRAHINNTGRLEQFLVPGAKGYCLEPRKRGATDFRLIAVADRGAAALIDTQLQMRAFESGVQRGVFPWLEGYNRFRRNHPLGRSLIDYRLEGEQEVLFLEAKSAVLREGSAALYPDSPTLRGQKHVRELKALADRGERAAILFIAALPGIEEFRPNRKADPDLYAELRTAAAAGVALRAIGMSVDPAAARVVLYAPELSIGWGDGNSY
jgi:sugar fermentation stimulation protein A